MKNLIGQSFDRLTVIKRVENDKNGRLRWLCLCICGNEKIVIGSDLKSGNTKSCGCHRKETSIKNGRLRKKYTEEEKLKRERESRKRYRDKNKEKCYNLTKRWRVGNLERVNSWLRKSRSIHRDWIIQFKTGKGCAICGENRSACLDFHHKDPKTKLFNISQCHGKNKTIIKNEIEKCTLLCANCHRCLHFNNMEYGCVNFKEINNGK